MRYPQMDDPFDLARFVAAQDGTIDRAIAELRAGAKAGHWMWFVFPQVAGLGRSATARHYALSGVAEARAYLAHPCLGPGLAAATDALLAAPGDDPVAILGAVDAMKLRSSMTLFAAAGGDDRFRAVLDRFFAGQEDAATRAAIG